jgi:ERCC4-related helicase
MNARLPAGFSTTAQTVGGSCSVVDMIGRAQPPGQRHPPAVCAVAAQPPGQPLPLGQLHPPRYAALDERTRNTWEYPASEDYPDRVYQTEIAAAALFQNTLVALPTGLGKTHIAAVVMYNFYRWFPAGQIVFLAPTRPLVTQQIEACFRIVGIPASDTAQICGSAASEKRIAWWTQRRVFFCTPQAFGNDVRNGRVDAARIVLVVVDEAHRASKNHAFVTCIQALDARRARYRLLALSATPGSDLNRVQAVIHALHISRIEVRLLDDPSVSKYRKETHVQNVPIPSSGPIESLRAAFVNVLDLLVAFLVKARAVSPGSISTKKLSQMQMLQTRDAFVEARKQGLAPVADMPDGIFSFACGTLTLLLQLAPALKELTTRGSRAFHQSLRAVDASATAPGVSPTSARYALGKREEWRKLMASLADMEKEGGEIIHPKLETMGSLLEYHFKRKAEAGVSTRAIVFTETRGSVDEILRCETFDAFLMLPSISRGLLLCNDRYLSDHCARKEAAPKAAPAAAPCVAVSIRAAPFVGQSRSNKLATVLQTKTGRGGRGGIAGVAASRVAPAVDANDESSDEGGDADADDDEDAVNPVKQQEALLREEIAARAIARLVASGKEEAAVALPLAESLEDVASEVENGRPAASMAVGAATGAPPQLGGGNVSQILSGSVALRGQTQKQQQEVMQAFRSGVFNVLVATCIGEVCGFT